MFTLKKPRNFGKFMLKINVFDKRLIKKIIDRLRDISDDGKIYFTKYPMISENYNLPSCISLRITLNNKNYRSWGTGITDDEATFKAVAELVERLFYIYSCPYLYTKNVFLSKKQTIIDIETKYSNARNWIGLTTSGIALHSTKKNAKIAAIDELIERHVILKAIATKIPPKKISPPKLIKNYKIPNNLSSQFFLWCGPLKRKVVLQQIKVNNGDMYSFGCHTNLEVAKEKAFLEGTGMMVFAYNNKNISPKNINSSTTRNIEMQTIQDYHRYDSRKEINDLLHNNSSHNGIVDINISKNDFYFSQFPTPEYLNDISPIVVIKCISPVLQPLFFDWWSPEIINPLAISIDKSELPKDLHVIS